MPKNRGGCFVRGGFVQEEWTVVICRCVFVLMGLASLAVSQWFVRGLKRWGL